MLRSKPTFWAMLCGAVVVAVLGIVFLASQAAPKTKLFIGGHSFQVDVAADAASLAQGLSGRRSLKPEEGMLFVFDQDDKWSMWMKDMYMPIDIIWLNVDKQVVDVEQNVSPDSYPNRYTPNMPARYVLEVAAGTVAKKRILPGDYAAFDITR